MSSQESYGKDRRFDSCINFCPPLILGIRDLGLQICLWVYTYSGESEESKLLPPGAGSKLHLLESSLEAG